MTRIQRYEKKHKIVTDTKKQVIDDEKTIIEDKKSENKEIKKEKTNNRKFSIKKFLITTLLILFTFFIYCRYIENIIIKVHEYPIISDKLSKNNDGLKIVQFSDIHYGSTTNLKTIKKVVKKINYLEPDVVIYSGDLLDAFSNIDEKEAKQISKELKKISAPIAKYAIIGDDDYNDIENYLNIMIDADFDILDNEHRLLFYKDNEPILLTGVSSKIDNSKINDTSLYQETNYKYHIALIHEPDNINEIDNNDYNLVLAGHSIGGQIKLPFIKGLIRIKGCRKYINEYYKVDKTDMYINNGIGTKTTKLRFLNAPSINLYRFYSK